MQQPGRPGKILAQGAILRGVACKADMGAKVWKPGSTHFTVPAGDGGVDRHALAVFRDAGELVPEDERVIKLCVAYTTLGEPMQVRAAKPDCSHLQ